jgi:hypothetical protein
VVGASEEEHRGIVEGLAAIAVTAAELGATEEEARQQLALWFVRLEVQSSGVLREAAAAISSFPQPPDEPAERPKRGRPIREMLGLPEPSEELEAVLRSREWLDRLADELDRRLQ